MAKKQGKKQSLPKGWKTKSAYNAWRAIGYLDKNGYIPSRIKETVSKMASYQTDNKDAALRELVEYYSMEPDTAMLFGKGSAHEAIAAHYSKSGGAAGLKDVLEKLEAEGRLQAASTQQFQAQSSKDLKMLQPFLKDETTSRMDSLKGFMAPAHIEGTLYPTFENYDMFAKSLLEEKNSTDDKMEVKFSRISNLITDKYYGAARMALWRLNSMIENELSELKSAVNYGSGDISDESYLGKRLAEFKSNVETFITQLGTELGGNALVSDITQFKIKDQSGTESTISVDSDITNGEINTYDNAKKFIAVVDKLWNSRESALVQGYNKGTSELARKQFSNIRELAYKAAQRKEIASRRSLAERLKRVFYSIGQIKQQGVINRSEETTLLKRWRALADRLKDIPSLDMIMSDVQDQDQIRRAYYLNAQITYHVGILENEVSSAASLKSDIEKYLARTDLSKSTIIQRFQGLYNHVDKMSQLEISAKDEIKKNTFRGITDWASATDQWDRWKKAYQARNTLKAIISSLRACKNTKEAITIMAQFNNNSELKTNLGYAIALADFVSKKDFADVVQRQGEGLTEAMKASTRQKRLISTAKVAPYFFSRKPFSDQTNTEVKKKISEMQSACFITGRTKGISYCELPSLPAGNDPRVVSAMLPSALATLDSQEARARANAGSKYLAELMGRFDGMMGMNAQLASGNLNSASQFDMLNKNQKRFQSEISGISYDKSLGLEGTACEGLYIAGFMKPFGSSDMDSAPEGILSPSDFLLDATFRGDTLFNYKPEGAERKALRQAKITVAGKQKPIALQQDGYLVRRQVVNDYGQKEVFDWSPVDAENLRNRLFVGLYPFKLSGRFLELYNKEMAVIKNLKIDTEDEVAIDSSFAWFAPGE